MTKVHLGSSEETRVRPRVGSHAARQGCQLNRVADAGAGAMHLNSLNVGGLNGGVSAGSKDKAGLGLRVHTGDWLALGVLVDSGAQNEPLAGGDPIVLGQQKADAALAAYVAISLGTEGMAAEGGRQEVGLPKMLSSLYIIPSVGSDIIKALKSLHHKVLSGSYQVVADHQRGRAGSVDGHGRALEVECVGNPRGQGAVSTSQDRVYRLFSRQRGRLPDAHVNANPLLVGLHSLAELSADRLPHRVHNRQRQDLLGVNGVQFSPGDAKRNPTLPVVET
eukprot:scaffold86792_cov45-Prasinocladus_malaysianus.AAC.3